MSRRNRIRFATSSGPPSVAAAAVAAALAVAVSVALAGCAPPGSDAAPVESGGALQEDLVRVLGAELQRIHARAEVVDSILHPLPLLTPAAEADLRRSTNAEHLARARSLGVAPPDSVARRALEAEGRLVALEDSTAQWVLRRLDYSLPLATPDARAMLVDVGARFHAALAELGLPPFRLDVTSVLRTAEQQAQLRRANPNAASGQSTHEFGTTVDIAYSGFAAPRDTSAGEAGEASALAPYVARIHDLALERVAARRSRELQAILGRVLRELQAEGVLLVTLERQQPVYHITVARRAEGS